MDICHVHPTGTGPHKLLHTNTMCQQQKKRKRNDGPSTSASALPTFTDLIQATRFNQMQWGLQRRQQKKLSSKKHQGESAHT